MPTAPEARSSVLAVSQHARQAAAAVGAIAHLMHMVLDPTR